MAIVVEGIQKYAHSGPKVVSTKNWADRTLLSSIPKSIIVISLQIINFKSAKTSTQFSNSCILSVAILSDSPGSNYHNTLDPHGEVSERRIGETWVEGEEEVEVPERATG